MSAKITAAKKAAKRTTQQKVEPGQRAAEQGLGKNALAAGEYIANKYIPQNAQQISTEANPNVAQALQAQNQYTQATGDQRAALARQNDIAQNGLGAQVYQAERDQLQRGQQSQFATSQNNLAKAQARGKVYGAAGAAQMANNVRANTEAGLNNEQQLMIQSANLKNTANQAYGNLANTEQAQLAGAANQYSQATQAADAAAADKAKFNIGESDALTAARLGTIANTAGLVNANRTNQLQQGLGADSINAAGGKTAHYDKAMGGSVQAAKSSAKRRISAGVYR